MYDQSPYLHFSENLFGFFTHVYIQAFFHTQIPVHQIGLPAQKEQSYTHPVRFETPNFTGWPSGDPRQDLLFHTLSSPKLIFSRVSIPLSQAVGF